MHNFQVWFVLDFHIIDAEYESSILLKIDHSVKGVNQINPNQFGDWLKHAMSVMMQCKMTTPPAENVLIAQALGVLWPTKSFYYYFSFSFSFSFFIFDIINVFAILTILAFTCPSMWVNRKYWFNKWMHRTATEDDPLT